MYDICGVNFILAAEKGAMTANMDAGRPTYQRPSATAAMYRSRGHGSGLRRSTGGCEWQVQPSFGEVPAMAATRTHSATGGASDSVHSQCAMHRRCSAFAMGLPSGGCPQSERLTQTAWTGSRCPGWYQAESVCLGASTKGRSRRRLLRPNARPLGTWLWRRHRWCHFPNCKPVFVTI